MADQSAYQESEYTLVVEAQDEGKFPRSATAVVKISLLGGKFCRSLSYALNWAELVHVFLSSERWQA